MGPPGATAEGGPPPEYPCGLGILCTGRAMGRLSSTEPGVAGELARRITGWEGAPEEVGGRAIIILGPGGPPGPGGPLGPIPPF